MVSVVRKWLTDHMVGFLLSWCLSKLFAFTHNAGWMLSFAGWLENQSIFTFLKSIPNPGMESLVSPHRLNIWVSPEKSGKRNQSKSTVQFPSQSISNSGCFSFHFSFSREYLVSCVVNGRGLLIKQTTALLDPLPFWPPRS